jgi:hypothetical protein
MKDLIYLLRLGFQSPSHANKKCIEAADALERLTAERDAYQIAADKMAMEHKIERDALGRQIDALAKDAARYRWLRTCSNDSHVIYGDTQNCELMMEEVLDAAIDEAIAKESQRISIKIDRKKFRKEYTVIAGIDGGEIERDTLLPGGSSNPR